VLTLDEPRLLAIVNVTPDSFSDGGLHATPDRACAFAIACLDAGAALVDLGGESTRPGAARVPAAEQARRVVPVIERILEDRPDALISVDTTRWETAREALDAGAHAINDVSAGREDERIFDLAAEREAGLILMHRLRAPGADVYSHEYGAAREPAYGGDVAGAVRRFLTERAEAAIARGVRSSSIVIDPGLGFGKTVEQNYELIRAFGSFLETGFHVLSASSRKSFLGRAAGVEAPSQRGPATLGVSLTHLAMGGRLFRVHDVALHREAFATAWRARNPQD